ncbi:MAG: serine/threonine protein kinase [Alphaproteobacteria bacterium]|nr:serine/threonine protein kinase [Alphaproteobacteria bacterium]
MNTLRSIGRYRVEELLGTGAMGEVYRAHDPAIDRMVAIKVVRPELVAGSGGAQLLERFRREARAAGRRFHPNIVAIWDFGDDAGMPFLVMELVEGRSLDQVIKLSGSLEPRRSVGIITQVLGALGFAHENGIVHRDIKPSNVMVLQDDRVKVADFGIARIEASEFTIVGDLLGTPAYMAPEQLSGSPIDHRTDLFAAGVILFETLTGVKPFRGKSITEIMSLMEKRGPEDIRALNPSVPEALKHVIIKSVSFDPAQRYADAAAFSKALAEALPQMAAEPPDRASATSEVELRTASPVATFTAEVLREIERDLATFIGPMASIVVKRAARQASDLPALYELLGRQVANTKDRAEFLAKGRQRAAAGFGQATPPPRPASVKPAEQRSDRSVNSPNPASIVAIESDLTRYIGPIARILVKRELTKFESLAKLCLVLATHIPDERQRRAFLNAHGAEQ